MYLANTLSMVGLLLGAVTTVYLMKNPPAKGEPYSRKQKLMMIPFILGSCFILAGSFLFFTRP